MYSLGSIEEARRVFDKYDKNGDGKISYEELQETLDQIGPKAMTPEEIKHVVAELDKDGDGHIDFPEFLELFRGGSTDGAKEEEILRDAFNIYDIDGNGLISLNELHLAMKKLGEKCDLSYCKKMIASVDKDGDGNVSFEEFKALMGTKKPSS